ncbi:MAG: copper-containing nitrite reductase [Pseudomonadota bacterium]|jgi:nitrite reductase (NO-forming)
MSTLRTVLKRCLALPALLVLSAGLPAFADTMGGGHGMPNASYTLRTGVAGGKMVYIGKGGEIEGKVNPDLVVHEGDIVQITLINGEGAEHDIAIPEEHAQSQHVNGPGASSTITFHAMSAGSFVYFCTLPGHREAGMEGRLKVERAAPPANVAQAGVDIARDPADLPPPLAERGPTSVHVDLEAVELTGRLSNKATYQYWTFNGKVPGPMIRVRVGDTVTLSLKNAADSIMMHNIDLHAVNGPGGGAVATEVTPGETKGFTFKALTPGLYVYHCATPMVSNHISNGMYGMILVEPPGGLPKVDREFYVMQGELYTTAPYGEAGAQEFSVEKLLAEHPEYIVFNGAVGALTQTHPLKAKVGEKVRIFFGVGGPNLTSSFHVIGTIFDHAYDFGAVESPPLQGVQTVTVPPGGATIVDLSLPVPGRFVLVDHALSRMEHGLAGYLVAEGPPAPDIFKTETSPRPPAPPQAHQH